MKKLFITLTIALVGVTGLKAQRVLTLEEAINIAIDNNLNIKRAQNTMIGAKMTMTQRKMSFLPSLSASSSSNWNEGAVLNTAQERLTINSWTARSGLGTGVTLFNGFAMHNRLAQSKYNYNASLNSIDNTKLSTRVSVVVSYLQVIQGGENVKVSSQRLGTLQQQLTREEKRQEAGVGTMEQVYNLRSQVANERLNYVNLENNLKSSELALLQLLLLDPTDNYTFEPLNVDDEELLNVDVEAFETFLKQSTDFSPSLKQADNSLKASEKGFKIAQAGRLPSITANASVGTSWTSRNAAENFRTQYDNNFGKGLGFNLNIPIFSNGQINSQVQQSKINMLNAELSYEQAKNDLTNLVQRAYLDMINAQSVYRAATESQESLETSFQFAKTQYENGTIDFTSYLQRLNAKNQGEFQLNNAKYGFLLRRYVLDLYKGNANIPSSR